MKKLILSAAAVLTATLPMLGADQEFSYSDPDAEVKAWSLMGLAEQYDVAIFIDNAKLIEEGAKIKGFRVPVPNESNPISDYKGWLSVNLKVNKDMQAGEAVEPDIVTVDGEVKDGILTVSFPEPYQITSDGVYVGYSFNVEQSTGAAQYPIYVTVKTQPNALFFRTRNTIYNWNEGSSSSSWGYSSAMVVYLESNIPDNVCDVAQLSDAFAVVGDHPTLNIKVTNQGAAIINNISYEFTYDGETREGIYTFDSPINNIPGSYAEFEVAVPERTELGTREVEFVVTKVNGEDNLSENKSIKSHITVVDHLPKHRPLMEEYTGMWCGWCPRGMAGMELLNAEFEDFIGYAVHYKDKLQLQSNLPGYETIQSRSFPSMRLDRVIDGDPFFGTGTNRDYRMILTDYAARANEFAPADLSLTATWADDDATSLQLDAKADFVLVPYENETYAFAYMLVADGLCSDDPFDEEWMQSNTYAGSSSYDEALQTYCDLPNPIADMVYNDVLAYSTSYSGVSGSLPKEIAIDSYTHSHVVKMSDCVSTEGVNFVGKKDMIKAIVALLKIKDGNVTVANAAAVNVDAPTSGSGIAGLEASQVVASEYYTPAGVRIANPDKGIYVRVDYLANGEKRTVKTVK